MSAIAAVTPTLDIVVLERPDTVTLARFCSALLGSELVDTSDADWATIVHP